MGPIVDRSKEMLARTDKSIIAARKLILDAAKTVEDGGSPLGTDDSYYDICAIERVLPEDAHWLDTLKGQMYPTGASFQPVWKNFGQGPVATR